MPTALRVVSLVFLLVVLSVQSRALTPAAVFDKVKDTVVVVRTLDARGKIKSQGSGVLLSSDRVVTNCHVVDEGASFQVGRGNHFIVSTLYAEDVDKDICILAADNIPGIPAVLGRATGLRVGDPVYAVGAPKGLELSLSSGIVSQLRGGVPPLIQTTAAISPGSSGGGLFDGEGRVVGLTTLYMEGGQNLNFAMPVEWIWQIKPGRKVTAKGIGRTEWQKRVGALEERKDWLGVIALCKKWIKHLPQDPEPWFALGIAYKEMGRYVEAADACRQAISLEPKYAGFWVNLGIVYVELKRYDAAVGAYREAARIDPNDRTVWGHLGYAYSKLGRFEDAIEAYHEQLRISPNDADMLTLLGVAYVRSGNRSSALKVVRKLRNLDPVKADQLFNYVLPP